MTHLEGAIDGTVLPAGQVHTLHSDRPIVARYDLDELAATWTKQDLAVRPPTIWRWAELLPPIVEPVTLGEYTTPLLEANTLGRHFGLSNLYVKDESSLPTGSFKSRGQAIALSMARQLGIRRVAIPTAGNAGGAMAAYAARAGLEAFVFMPTDTPTVNRQEVRANGANLFLVDGLIDDCGRIVRSGIEEMGWFDVSTLKEPYRLEGKKTMGFEICEQLQWSLPDVILYPTGGGTGLIGMWKAFQELVGLGWIDRDSLPRMVAVQSDGCAPVVRAFESGERFCDRFENASTVASGIRVPAAVGDFMMLDAVRDSDGRAVAVREEDIVGWMHRATSMEGIRFCPESAACVAAIDQLRDDGWLGADERVVLFNCATGNKYTDVSGPGPELPRIDPTTSIDWDLIKRNINKELNVH